jgi:putative acetyltransferase
MAVLIREQQVSDAENVRALITAAFADEGRVASLAEALRARPDLGAGIVAEQCGEVVGHTQLSISWIDDADRLIHVLTLSPLSVTPHRQRQGIGTALLTRAAQVRANLGVPALFLEGDPRITVNAGTSANNPKLPVALAGGLQLRSARCAALMQNSSSEITAPNKMACCRGSWVVAAKVASIASADSGAVRRIKTMSGTRPASTSAASTTPFTPPK